MVNPTKIDYKSKAIVLRLAAYSIEMQVDRGIKPVWLKKGAGMLPILNGTSFNCNSFDEGDEFPLAVVEDKPVFIGAVCYTEQGYKRIASKEWWVAEQGEKACSFGNEKGNKYSWSSPLPDIVMVPLYRKDAEAICGSINWPDVAAACKKVLEK